MKNEMTDEQHAKYLEKAAADYTIVVNELLDTSRKIATKVSELEPLKLLKDAYWEHIHLQLGIESEDEMGAEHNDSFSQIEYLQSCIVSWRPNDLQRKFSAEDRTYLKSAINKLYNDATLRFQIANAAKRKIKGHENRENDELFFRLVTMWVRVRGKRYLNHEEEHLTDLLSPHDQILDRLFGVTGRQIAKGMTKMMFSLVESPMLFKRFQDLQKIVFKAMKAKIGDLEASGTVVDEELVKKIAPTISDELGLREEFKFLNDRMFGDELFNVEVGSGLPSRLLDRLALAPGQDAEFFSKGLFPGTPLKRLPIHSKPFLKYGDRYYLYHPHILSDHLYRNIQAIVAATAPEYDQEWNQKQKQVSENLPFDLILTILPNATVYRNFTYTGKDRTGQSSKIECDGIILYHGLLFVIEAKGGKSSTKPPAENIESHFKSIKDLLAAPAEQGRRFVETLKERIEVVIFGSTGRVLATIRLNDFREIAIVGVPLEQLSDVSSIAQQFEKFEMDKDGMPVWLVSLDDLRVYRDIFKSSISFTHFVVERLRAFQNPRLILDDELDQLGLYLSKNRYHELTDDFKDVDRITWGGFRVELDKYFHRKLTKTSSAVLPNQKIPAEIQNLLDVLEASKEPGYIWVGHQLLDFGENGRNMLAESLREVPQLQVELGRVRPFTLHSEVSLSFVIQSPGIMIPSDFVPRDYGLCNMTTQNGEKGLLFELELDSTFKLVRVKYEWLSKEMVVGEFGAKIQKKAQSLQKNRIEMAKAKAPKSKIGRNELCPCGSRKKFKNCHGR